MSIYQFLASENYIIVNRSLINLLGLEASVLLGEFASESAYWNERGEAENGFFFSTIENVEERTSLSVYQQKQAIDLLVEKGLIECRRKGMPARRFIRINESSVCEFLTNKIANNSQTSLRKTSKHDCEKLLCKNTKEKNTKKEDKKERKKTSTFDDILDSVEVIKDHPDLRDAFLEYIKMRKLIKKPLTDRALKLNINEAYKLSGGDAEQMRAIVEQSIKRSWAGMFPIKEADSLPQKRSYRSGRTGGDAGIVYQGNADQKTETEETKTDIFSMFEEE